MVTKNTEECQESLDEEREEETSKRPALESEKSIDDVRESMGAVSEEGEKNLPSLESGEILDDDGEESEESLDGVRQSLDDSEEEEMNLPSLEIREIWDDDGEEEEEEESNWPALHSLDSEDTDPMPKSAADKMPESAADKMPESTDKIPESANTEGRSRSRSRIRRGLAAIKAANLSTGATIKPVEPTPPTAPPDLVTIKAAHSSTRATRQPVEPTPPSVQPEPTNKAQSMGSGRRPPLVPRLPRGLAPFSWTSGINRYRPHTSP